MTKDGYDYGRVRIAPETLAARWLTARSYQLDRPLAAIVRRSRPTSVFVADELLVDAADAETLARLERDFDAVVEPPPPIPPQPDGMDPERQRSVEGMPAVARVRLPAERLPLDGIDKAARRIPEGELSLTSHAGAGTLALLRRLLDGGAAVMPNLVGEPSALPLRTSTEGNFGGANNPYAWPEFAGPTRIAQAWMLVQAYEQARSLRTPIFLGVIDDGFALDGNGQPLLINGQPLDVGGIIQWNLITNSRPAGGPGGNIGSAWHGKNVLSAAAAINSNNRGAAGAAGLLTLAGIPLVVPVLFKTSIDAWETINALRLCVAWGVDVINMSWGFIYNSAWDYRWDGDFPTSVWERTFQFAADQGLVMIAAAGNSASELPEAVVLPATRTPGVITVGATNNTPDNRPRPSSNYGSSVAIWAPGTNIHVAPNPGATGDAFFNGTSAAAPLVAGVAALMLAVDPNLSGGDIQRILVETAYHNLPDPKVTSAMNAQAALMRVIGGRLPDTLNEEPNNTPQTALRLGSLPGGLLGPIGPTLLADAGDVDWFFFQSQNYAGFEATLDFLPELSSMNMELFPDDPHSRALAELARIGDDGRVTLRINLLAPGGYRLRVRGSGPNIYRLRVRLILRPLNRDQFEANDTFESAARFRITPPRRIGDFHIEHYDPDLYFPGRYEANLHTNTDVDYYRISEINPLALVLTLFHDHRQRCAARRSAARSGRRRARSAGARRAHPAAAPARSGVLGARQQRQPPTGIPSGCWIWWTRRSFPARSRSTILLRRSSICPTQPSGWTAGSASSGSK